MDYTKEPISLSEVKAIKNGDCTLWTPRDALVNLLRDVDSGEIKIETIFIGFISEKKNTHAGYCCSGESPMDVIGVAYSALKKYMDAGQ